MKRIIAIILSVVFIFLLTSCGKQNNHNTNDSNNTTNENNTESSDNELLTDVNTDKNDNENISRGTIDGDIYTNKFVGITFTKPTDWKYLSDKEIAETFGDNYSLLNYDSIEAALSENEGFYDMIASYNRNGYAIMMNYSKANVSPLKKLSEKEYLNDMISRLEKIEEIKYSFSEIEDKILSGTQFKKLTASYSATNIEWANVYYVRIIGDYIATITFSCPKSAIMSFEALFN